MHKTRMTAQIGTALVLVLARVVELVLMPTTWLPTSSQQPARMLLQALRLVEAAGASVVAGAEAGAVGGEAVQQLACGRPRTH